MRLANYSTLLAQVGMAATPDYVTIAQAELETASATLENDLNTEFDQVSLTETFMPYDNELLTKFKVSRGFLQPGSLKVSYARTPAAWYLNQTVDITSVLTTDPLRGTFWVDGALMPLYGSYNYLLSAQLGDTPYYGLQGAYFQASYSAGFPVSDSDPEMYDPAVVPSWLQTLALLKARIGLGSHPSAVAAGVKFDSVALENQYGAIVSRRTLYAPDCILPRL